MSNVSGVFLFNFFATCFIGYVGGIFSPILANRKFKKMTLTRHIDTNRHSDLRK